MKTVYGTEMGNLVLSDYFASLVNKVFKVLPIREREEATLVTYLDSLAIELMGYESLLPSFSEDGEFISILSTVRYLRDNPDLPVPVVKREVFRMIASCKKIEKRYGEVDRG